MTKNLRNTFIILFFLVAPVLSFSQVLFSESFSTGNPPPAWTNDSLGIASQHMWIFNNSFSRNISGANFDSLFAIFDSDEGGIDDGLNEIGMLTTPPINISTAAVSLFLEYDEQFRGVTGIDGGTRMIEMSTDSGASWIMIDSSQVDNGYPNPAVHMVYDISSVMPETDLLIRFHYTGSWDWWWAIDNVEVICRQLCTTPPYAGHAQSNFSTVCPSDTFYLSLTGEDQATNLDYQWQSSIDNVIWNDLTGDTSVSINHLQTSDTYYRCALICSGQTAYSLPVFVSMTDLINCYCVGVFTDGCDILDKVIFNTLSNIASDCNGNPDSYINYPDTGLTTTTVYSDSTYDLTIATGFGSGNHGAGVWFDFDHNGDFLGVNEFFHISDSIPEMSPDFTVPITIPSNANGVTRMRVRYVYDSPIIQTSVCDEYTFGETEDYTIYIINITLSIQNNHMDNINVYPVPVTDRLYISSPSNIGMIKFSLFDQTGRLCLSTCTNLSVTDINVGTLSRGIYFLRMETEKGTVTKKVILN